MRALFNTDEERDPCGFLDAAGQPSGEPRSSETEAEWRTHVMNPCTVRISSWPSHGMERQPRRIEFVEQRLTAPLARRISPLLDCSPEALPNTNVRQRRQVT